MSHESNDGGADETARVRVKEQKFSERWAEALHLNSSYDSMSLRSHSARTLLVTALLSFPAGMLMLVLQNLPQTRFRVRIQGHTLDRQGSTRGGLDFRHFDYSSSSPGEHVDLEGPWKPPPTSHGFLLDLLAPKDAKPQPFGMTSAFLASTDERSRFTAETTLADEDALTGQHVAALVYPIVDEVGAIYTGSRPSE
ncbi:hypothetical protein N7532_002090 [Penicillium argentinense]|uniref:Uncharacterized protein n=1 Tax=Penicillium argentinense TaxID=1131581 RepID=A0A9W9KME0_9EURO|nr:uncharacterized protein N7532_002090 [Penicillium argentinense]KAJ5111555.1 hypothetical protein N7532_002090 [Penicillium argentinense]